MRKVVMGILLLLFLIPQKVSSEEIDPFMIIKAIIPGTFIQTTDKNVIIITEHKFYRNKGYGFYVIEYKKYETGWYIIVEDFVKQRR